MITKGCLVRTHQYPEDIYLVISDTWKDSQGAMLVDVLAVDPMNRLDNDTVYIEDLEVISGV